MAIQRLHFHKMAKASRESHQSTTMPQPGAEIEIMLRGYGIPPRRIRVLDDQRLEPRHLIEYADLLRPAKDDSIPAVEAVIEASGQPVIYALRRPLMQPHNFRIGIQILRRRLACRGGRSFLAVEEGGHLTIYPCGLQAKDVKPLPGLATGSSLLRQIIDGSGWQQRADDADPKLRKALNAEQRSVHNVLLKSITAVAAALRGSEATAEIADRSTFVLCLVGRALLTRFLIDRGILTSSPADEADAGQMSDTRSCFDHPELAARTCRWLDLTFNGDLLQLSTGEDYSSTFNELHAIDDKFFRTLGCLLRAEEGGQLRLDLWQVLDFAYVPVGLLSEVYDDLARTFSPEKARRTSVHYTPAAIAQFLVDQTLDALLTCKVSGAKVLDPAVGAGIFLTLALRRMYAALWAERREAGLPRPGTEHIREMLYKQLAGFDVNADALNLAALSLYLTAIELDPSPSPPEKLAFQRPLIGTVLYDVSSGATDELGSLRPGTHAELYGHFDAVICNPPWTALPKDAGRALDAAAAEIAAGVLARARPASKPSLDAGTRRAAHRQPSQPAEYRNPDHVPDLPFVWQATNWAKPGGLLAFVLHGRLLFKSTTHAVEARSALFDAVAVTGILDGAELSEAVGIWPGVSAPFCIVFAENARPEELQAFRFVSPLHEAHVNRTGRFRIDPYRVHEITASRLRREPTLLKTLSKGDALDLALMRKLARPVSIHGQAVPKVRLASLLQRHGLVRHSGYQEGKEENQRDASKIMALGGKKLTGDDETAFVIDTSRLPEFDLERLEWPRKPEIFQPPLMLVREAAKVNEQQPIASIHFGRAPIVYTDAFTGYYRPSGTHEQAGQTSNVRSLMAYLATVLCSPMLRYHMLMTSSKYAVERRAWNTFEIDNFPLPDFDELPRSQREPYVLMAAAAEDGRSPKPHELINLANQAFGLTEDDAQLMAEALEFGQPTQGSRDAAARQPATRDIEAFREALQKVLDPLAALVGVSLRVSTRPDLRESVPSFAFLEIRELGNSNSGSITEEDMAELAEFEGCSIVTDVASSDGLIRVGLLAQRRFWRRGRARLLADDILRHVDEWLAARAVA